MSSKLRSVDTHFWEDNYISECDPIEKLLFLYLLTNPLTNMLGIYEIPLKRIAFDTGIDKEMLTKLFARFDKNDKIAYIDGHVVLFNFTKRQKYNTNMTKSAVSLYKKLNNSILEDERVRNIGLFFGIENKPFERVPKGSERFVKEEVEIETEIETETEVEEEAENESESDLISSSTSGLNLMLKDKHGNTLAEIICSTMGNDYLEQIISKKKTIDTFFKTVEARGLKSFLDWTNYVAKNDLEMEHLQNQLKVKPDRIRKDLKDFYAYHKGQSKLYTKKDFRSHFINWKRKQ